MITQAYQTKDIWQHWSNRNGERAKWASRLVIFCRWWNQQQWQWQRSQWKWQWHFNILHYLSILFIFILLLFFKVNLHPSAQPVATQTSPKSTFQILPKCIRNSCPERSRLSKWVKTWNHIFLITCIIAIHSLNMLSQCIIFFSIPRIPSIGKPHMAVRVSLCARLENGNKTIRRWCPTSQNPKQNCKNLHNHICSVGCTDLWNAGQFHF